MPSAEFAVIDKTRPPPHGGAARGAAASSRFPSSSGRKSRMPAPLHLVATCVLGLEEILEAELRSAADFCDRARARRRHVRRHLGGLLARQLAAAHRQPRAGRAGFLGGLRRPVARRRSAGAGRAAAAGTAACEPAASTPAPCSPRSAASASRRPRPPRRCATRAGPRCRSRTAWWTASATATAGGPRSTASDPDLHLRVRLHRDRATLLLDTSGEPLDRRGYRGLSTAAPVREQLAAACVLASGWDGRGPVADPMCGSGTLLVEAAWFALGRAPGSLRRSWAFERLPGFDPRDLRACPQGADAPRRGRTSASMATTCRARRSARRRRTWNGQESSTAATLTRGDAKDLQPPPETGLVLVNPPHGERIETDAEALARPGGPAEAALQGMEGGGPGGRADRGKQIGLRPRRRIPVMNGPLEARILLFDLF